MYVVQCSIHLSVGARLPIVSKRQRDFDGEGHGARFRDWERKRRMAMERCTAILVVCLGTFFSAAGFTCEGASVPPQQTVELSIDAPAWLLPGGGDFVVTVGVGEVTNLVGYQIKLDFYDNPCAMTYSSHWLRVYPDTLIPWSNGSGGGELCAPHAKAIRETNLEDIPGLGW